MKQKATSFKREATDHLKLQQQVIFVCMRFGVLGEQLGSCGNAVAVL